MPILGPPGALSPSEWGARVDYDTWRDFYTPDDGVALHHGGGSDYRAGRPPFSQAEEIAQLRAWESFHIDGRGWRGLAYGWAVGQTGALYRIRGWASYGAHTGDVDGDGIANNAEIIPILYIGSGHHHEPSPAAQDGIVRIRSWVEAQASNAVWLYGHTELGGTATSCPGPKVMTYIRARRRLTIPGGPSMTWTPGDPVEDIDAARGVFAYLGPVIYKAADFAYDENNPANFDERMKVLIARIAVILMQHHDRLVAEEAEGPGSGSQLSEAQVQAIVDQAVTGHGHKGTVTATVELT